MGSCFKYTCADTYQDSTENLRNLRSGSKRTRGASDLQASADPALTQHRCPPPAAAAMMMDELEDPGPRKVPSGSSEFQKALQEVLCESELHSNGTCRVTIKAPGDKAKDHREPQQHQPQLPGHGQQRSSEDRLLQGKEHCYRLHHGNVLPSYSHHRPPTKTSSPSSSRSPNLSPSRSPVSPRRHVPGQKVSPPLSSRMRELSVEEAGPMSRQRSNSDCPRRPVRPKQQQQHGGSHHPSHAHHGHPTHEHGHGSHRGEGHSHPRDHSHLHPHSHLHVHWPDSGAAGRLDEVRSRSLSFGAVDGMRKPSKSILKHPES